MSVSVIHQPTDKPSQHWPDCIELHDEGDEPPRPHWRKSQAWTALYAGRSFGKSRVILADFTGFLLTLFLNPPIVDFADLEMASPASLPANSRLPLFGGKLVRFGSVGPLPQLVALCASRVVSTQFSRNCADLRLRQTSSGLGGSLVPLDSSRALAKER